MRPPAAPKADKTAVDIALQYLEANYSEHVSLAELAELSQFSASHFQRMFKNTIGLTPHAYLTQFRVELAASLLKSGMPLVDVANMVGFTDQSHFTRKFKRILGVTPWQYISTSKSALRRN